MWVEKTKLNELDGVYMLDIRDLVAGVAGEAPILKGLDLKIPTGQVHAVMGPNGSGKSTLANVLAGRDTYQVAQGTIQFAGDDLLALSPEARAAAGLFLAFQYPVALPGVNSMVFLKAALNSQRKARGEPELDAMDVMERIERCVKVMGMDDSLLRRSVNEDFSGGEKKRYEIMQMMVLQPRFAILDETDSGLDIDALKVVSEGVNAMRDASRSMLVITHYQRLLNYIEPDVVHVLIDGRIVESGDKHLAEALEKSGYAAFASGGA